MWDDGTGRGTQSRDGGETGEGGLKKGDLSCDFWYHFTMISNSGSILSESDLLTLLLGCKLC